MKKLLLLLPLLLLWGCSGNTTTPETEMANPASVYCIEQGGTLEMRENEAGTAGYCIFEDGTECEEWAYFRGECPKAEAVTEADIRAAFQEKYPDWNTANLEITFGDVRSEYASGTVNEKDEMGGGYFFAAKTENGWVIAADGNGVISCAGIEPYNFPTDMVVECWDEENQTTVER